MKINIINVLLEIIKFFSMFGIVVGYVENEVATFFGWFAILILSIIVGEVKE